MFFLEKSQQTHIFFAQKKEQQDIQMKKAVPIQSVTAFILDKVPSQTLLHSHHKVRIPPLHNTKIRIQHFSEYAGKVSRHGY